MSDSVRVGRWPFALFYLSAGASGRTLTPFSAGCRAWSAPAVALAFARVYQAKKPFELGEIECVVSL